MPRSKVSLAVCLLAALASLFLLVGPMAQAQNSLPVLITQNVDESKLVTLAGNTRPEAKKQNDRGLVADDLSMEHMFLQLKRSPELERELEQLIDELTDQSSPNFHHWLTAKELGERFGLATQDLNAITRWLESHGFKVEVVYENGVLIDFSGTAGQVRAAFHTEIHNLDVKGVQHIANMSDPKIPAALAPAIVGVVSLHDFKPHTNYKPRSNYTVGGGYFLVVPGDLATIYNINPLFSASISGQGQTIVVIEDTDVYNVADWASFRSVFGLSSYTDGTFTQIHPAPNNCSDPGVNGDEGEAILDAEYSSASAPSAAIELASCADTETTFGGLIALQNLLNESSTPPAVMSMSYGFCETFNGAAANAAYNEAYKQAVGLGVSVFVSAGDQGAASCDYGDDAAYYGITVSGFASTPYNVAVGGTDFGDTYAGTTSTYWSNTNSSTYESALSYIPEIPWNDSCASLLLAEFNGYSETYGASGFCNSGGGENFLTTTAGSGGPSGCATGASVEGAVDGTCAGWPKPSWQSLFGNPSDGVRDIPDVSLFAANGLWGHYYPFCDTDPDDGGVPCTDPPVDWPGAGGTSFASPIMAGIQALVNQKNGGRQGNPNPNYYRLAAAEYGASGDNSCNSTLGNAAGSSCIFYDVRQGDMDVNCAAYSDTQSFDCYYDGADTLNGVLSTSSSAYEPAYGTTAGWDFATGIGTVNAANLANNWNTLATTTTTVISSKNPAVQGVAVTFTATVTTAGSHAPTGTVNFFDSAAQIGSGTLSTVSGSQVATFTTSTLSVGTHSITAVYVGDSNNTGSTSSVLSQVINAVVTTTTVVSSQNPAFQGVSVTFTATVTTTGAHAATGTVNFFDSAAQIGSGTLSTVSGSQVATFATHTLTVGTHSITAVYVGDANNTGSTSSILSQVINPLPATTTTVVSSQNPAVQGASVTFTATVANTSGHAATGTVNFFDSATQIGSGTLSTVSGSQVATFATSTLTVGTHSITAVYVGDSNNAGSTSAVLSQVINPVVTTTTVVSSQNPAFQNNPVTFTATVTTTGTHAPTGTVNFFDSATQIGSGTLSTVSGSQVTTFTTSALAVGTHSITAVYVGDANNTGSTSSILSQVINPLPATTTTDVSSANPAFQGETVTFTATVAYTSGHAPTGNVTFNDGGTAIGSGSLNGSQVATYTTSTLTVATHSITAVYAGDTNNAGSTSSALSQVINALSFTLTPATTTPAAIAPGAATMPDTITVTGPAGFVTAGQTAEALTYSCSGLPSESACVFTPSATTTSSTPTVSITTTPPSSSQPRASLGRGNGIFYAMLLPGLFGIFLTVGSRKRAARAARLLSFIVVLGLSTLWLAACGSSSHNPGTPAGSYMVVVSATAAGVTEKAATITLTVN